MKHLVRSGLLAAGVATATILVSAPAGAAYRFTTDDGKSLLVTGFLREHASMNLENHPEADGTGTHRLNGRGELSMLRSTFKLDLKADLGWMQAVAIYRKDWEYQTAYLDRLKKTVHRAPALGGQGPGGRDFMDVIQGDQIREAYIVVNPTERIRATLGKQQIVWGETDFFRAMDIINGFDLRWRSFLETENEELRKPLIMANVEIEVPEWNGQLQLVYRPGWDNAEDVGNDIDISGGRWATQPTKGVPFLPVLPFNYNRGSDDTSDANYGFRWVGDYRGVTYSLNYWRGLNPDPIANPFVVPGIVGVTIPAGGFAVPIGGLRGSYGSIPRPNGNPLQLGELVRPKIETFGATASGYLAGADLIYRMELAFTPNKPYNEGKNVGISLPGLGAGGIGGTLWVPGLGGVVERDTLVSMLGVDKQMKGWSEFLGTSQFPLLSFQLFDTWVTDFHKSDQIVETLGFGALRKEHTTLLTGLLQLNYAHNTINPSFAGVVDLTNKDFVLIPALELVFGDHWRIRTDADLFFAHASKNVKRQQIPGAPPGATAFVNEDFYAGRPEDDTHLLGTFANNSQFNVRITYQF